jgi:hypothetical protein
MFTENEVIIMLENKSIENAVIELKKDFIGQEAQYMELSDHDFLSLVLLTPSVGIALANDSVSLFEEMALNKKARKLSFGGYFMKTDPVVHAMSFLIKHYDIWKDKFYDLLKDIMHDGLDLDQLKKQEVADEDLTPNKFRKELLKAPYGFVRFMASFFCSEEDQIINVETRSISRSEYDRVLSIGESLGLNDIPIFRHFCATYTVK